MNKFERSHLEHPHHILSHLVHDGCGPRDRILGHAKMLNDAIDKDTAKLDAEIKRLRQALKSEAQFRCRKCLRGHRIEEIQSITGEKIWVHRSGEHSTLCSASHIHVVLEKTK